jgi:hypothetical protein
MEIKSQNTIEVKCHCQNELEINLTINHQTCKDCSKTHNMSDSGAVTGVSFNSTECLIEHRLVVESEDKTCDDYTHFYNAYKSPSLTVKNRNPCTEDDRMGQNMGQNQNSPLKSLMDPEKQKTK